MDNFKLNFGKFWFIKLQSILFPLSVITDILPPKGAGKDGNTTVSLAPTGGKGLRERGLSQIVLKTFYRIVLN